MLGAEANPTAIGVERGLASHAYRASEEHAGLILVCDDRGEVVDVGEACCHAGMSPAEHPVHLRFGSRRVLRHLGERADALPVGVLGEPQCHEVVGVHGAHVVCLEVVEGEVIDVGRHEETRSGLDGICDHLPILVRGGQQPVRRSG